MKATNVIDLYRVFAEQRYSYEFQMLHVKTLERIVNQFHKRAEAQKKRGA